MEWGVKKGVGRVAFSAGTITNSFVIKSKHCSLFSVKFHFMFPIIVVFMFLLFCYFGRK